MSEEIKQKAREEIRDILVSANMEYSKLVELFDSLLTEALQKRDRNWRLAIMLKSNNQ